MIHKHADGATVDVYVQPRASKTELAGQHDGMLKLRVAAPPVDGAANAEVIGFFSKLLGVPKRDISILSGEKGRRKKILVSGVNFSTLQDRVGG